MGDVIIEVAVFIGLGMVFLMVVALGFIALDIIRIIIESWREQM